MKEALADPQQFLRGLFHAAVAAADPGRCVPPYLPVRPRGRMVVVGAGKASAAMARAVEQHWQGAVSGLVVTRYGHGVACDQIEIVEAAHPVPDEAGLTAAGRILDLAKSLGPDDLLLCLISGGGSALLTLPAPGISLDDKQAVNRALLRSGASIGEMNCVRKHLSVIKGGRLAAAATPAQVVTLLISDVPGDDPAVIASGPTVGDPTSFADARGILLHYGISLPASVSAHLEAAQVESPKIGDPRLVDGITHLIAAPQASLKAAAQVAVAAGVPALILGDAIEGEAREVGIVHAGIAQASAAHGHPAKPPLVLLSGGETTVTVRGKGRGGRNSEFALGLALALDGNERIYALAADTDGIDGSEDNAGVLVAPGTLARAREAGIDPLEALANNDAYSLFAEVDGLVVTGPTLTNVNDFRAVLIL